MNERLKALRKKLGLTQTEFGAKLGLTTSAVSDIERGKVKSITESNMKLICREFGVNEVWLRTGEGGDENMFTKVSDDDRFSLNLGKLTMSENEFIKDTINYLAEADPEKLKIVEEFMKKILGIE